MQFKKFAGQVKVADVQEAFDRLTNRINELIDTYNQTEQLQHEDFSKGSPILGTNNYTLTLGGLKQVLRDYDGCIVGARAIKVGNNGCKVTPGLLFTKDQVYKIPDTFLAKTDKATALYFKPETNEVGFPAGDVTEFVGGAGAIPTIKANNTWGNINAGANAGEAYLAAAGGTWQTPGDWFNGNFTHDVNVGKTQIIDGVWTWTFPNKVNLNTIELGRIFANHKGFNFERGITIETIEGTVLHHGAIWSDDSTPFWGTEFGAGTIPVELETSGIRIRAYGGTVTKMAITDIRLTLNTIGEEIDNPTAVGFTDLEGCYKICDLDWTRDTTVLNTFPELMFAPDGTRTIARGNYGGDLNGPSGGNDLNQAQFMSGNLLHTRDNGRTVHGYLNGWEVEAHGHSDDRAVCKIDICKWLLIPQKVANPYTYDYGNCEKWTAAKLKNS